MDAAFFENPVLINIDGTMTVLSKEDLDNEEFLMDLLEGYIMHEKVNDFTIIVNMFADLYDLIVNTKATEMLHRIDSSMLFNCIKGNCIMYKKS